MIGYRGVRVQTVSDKHGNNVLFEPKTQVLKTGMLNLREEQNSYTQKQSFTVPVVDTGENAYYFQGGVGDKRLRSVTN